MNEDVKEEETQEEAVVEEAAEATEEETPEEPEEAEPEEEPAEEPEPEEVKVDKTAEEQAFLERRRKKHKEQPAPQATEQMDDMQELREAAQHLKMQRLYSGDKAVYNKMEKEFSENISDFESQKDMAIKATKMRLMHTGMSEADALAKIDMETIHKANQAYSNQQDPVEVVYEEYKQINSWVAAVAEEFGYKKAGVRSKTKAQALREASKPSAMTGGVGRPSSATRSTWDDLDDPKDVADVPLRDLI